MRKLFKKAFTLVELLVVIAILGVLATVSIVGYSSYTKRANLQADSTLVSEWNHLLMAEENINDIDNINDVKELFINNNTSSSTFIPKTNNYHFYWNLDKNNIYLVNDSDNNFDVYFPEESITSDHSYRLDLEYCLVSTNVAGVSLDKNALVINQSNEITLSGINANSVMINDEVKKLSSDKKLTLNPISNKEILIIQDPTIYLSNVTITPSEKQLYVDGTQKLTANILPTNATTNTVIWESSNTDVVTVNENGVITAKAKGTATITAKATDFFGTYTGTCNVSVVRIQLAKPTADTTSFTYNGNVQTYSLTANDNYTISNNKRTDAGSQKVTVTINNTAKYEWADTSIDDLSFDFIINKKDATSTAPTAKTSLTYSNSELELVNDGTTDGGEWQYKLNDGEYSTNVPKVKDAGTYTVYYKLVGNNNYNDITEASVQVTIAKKDATITTTGVTTEYTYTGSEQTVNSGATVDSGATLTYTNNKFTDRPSNGKQTVTISAAETANYNAASTTVEITINKATQTAPSAPGAPLVSSDSVTLEAISAGQGDTKYGCSTENNASKVTNWKKEVAFTGLEPETTYYFFAKYEGDTNYNEAVSSGTEIKTLVSAYTINTPTLSSNIKANTNNPTTIKTGETAMLTFTADEGSTFASTLPENAVLGATIKSWDSSTGTLVIENATNNVDISLLLPVVEEGLPSVNGVYTATATGNDLTYQWYSCDDSNYTNAQPIANETNKSFNAKGFRDGFFCVVSNEYGSSKTKAIID